MYPEFVGYCCFFLNHRSQECYSRSEELKCDEKSEESDLEWPAAFSQIQDEEKGKPG